MKIVHKWRIENVVNIIYPFKWECLFFCQVVIVRHLVNFVRSQLGLGFVVAIPITFVLRLQILSALGILYHVQSVGLGFQRDGGLHTTFSPFVDPWTCICHRESLYICPFAPPLMSGRTPLLFLGTKIEVNVGVILSSTSLASVPCPLGVGLCQCSLDNQSLPCV